MQLYLIRHAIAVDRASSVSLPDAQRALTETGIEKMTRHVRALKKLGVDFDVVLTSPLVRCVQTAEIVGDVLNCREKIERCEALAPGCDLASLTPTLTEHRTAMRVAMVGHNPDFETIASELLGCSESRVRFKKGAICRIDLTQTKPRPVGELVWHLTPKLLRMAAG